MTNSTETVEKELKEIHEDISEISKRRPGAIKDLWLVIQGIKLASPELRCKARTTI